MLLYEWNLNVQLRQPVYWKRIKRPTIWLFMLCPELRRSLLGSFEAWVGRIERVARASNELMGLSYGCDYVKSNCTWSEMKQAKKQSLSSCWKSLEFWTRSKRLIELIKNSRDTGDTVLVVAHATRYVIVKMDS